MDFGTSLLGDRGYTGLKEPVKVKVGKGLKKAAPEDSQLLAQSRDNQEAYQCWPCGQLYAPTKQCQQNKLSWHRALVPYEGTR